jgi:hypothetical protein
VAFPQKGWNLTVRLTHSKNFAQVTLCDMPGEERMGWDLSGVRLLSKPQWKGTGCQFPHTLETLA